MRGIRKTLLISVAIFLTGCSLIPERKITTQTIKVQIPVLYSEPPPILTRPDLAINDMPLSAKGNYALIARSYKISIIELISYVEQLEAVLENYKVISETLDTSGILINDGIEVTVD